MARWTVNLHRLVGRGVSSFMSTNKTHTLYNYHYLLTVVKIINFIDEREIQYNIVLYSELYLRSEKLYFTFKVHPELK